MRHAISVKRSLPGNQNVSGVGLDTVRINSFRSRNSWLRGKLSLKALLFIFLTTTIFFSVFFLLYQQFIVRDVIVEGLSPSETLQGIDAVRNVNIYTLDVPGIKRKIVGENPSIRSVSIVKKFPRTIILYVTEYTPFAQMQTSVGYMLLSNDGRVLGKTTSEKYTVPLINYYQKINHYSVTPGDWIRYDDIQKALHFLQTMKGLGLNVDTVDINGDNMILCSLGKKQVVFSTEINTSTQDYELEQVVEQLKIEGRDFSRLDLRFDKPLITF